MTNLHPHDYDVLQAVAEAGMARRAELHRYFPPGKHDLSNLQPKQVDASLRRLKKAGLVMIAVQGSGRIRGEEGIYPKGKAVANRWAATEEGRLLSGLNPPL